MAHFKLEATEGNQEISLDGTGAEIVALLCTAFAHRPEIKGLVELSLSYFKEKEEKIKEILQG